MKPLARWTMSNVSSAGFEILHESFKWFSQVYPEFDRILCYNNVAEELMEPFSVYAQLYKQTDNDLPCSIMGPDDDVEVATGSGWKLAPHRLRNEACELFVDNDVVIRERLPSIDAWLADGQSGLISEGLHRRRMYGEFDSSVPDGVHACAGFFGLPPNFDFRERILYFMQLLEGRPLGGWNEQGLTVAVVTNMTRYILVPLTSMHICEDHVPFPDKMPPAIHFVGSNRKSWHNGWKAYKRHTRRLYL